MFCDKHISKCESDQKLDGRKRANNIEYLRNHIVADLFSPGLVDCVHFNVLLRRQRLYHGACRATKRIHPLDFGFPCQILLIHIGKPHGLDQIRGFWIRIWPHGSELFGSRRDKWRLHKSIQITRRKKLVQGIDIEIERHGQRVRSRQWTQGLHLL